jgi:hypothetical protein
VAKIYVASSWRNPYQPGVVGLLRDAGHDVYDFRNPRPGEQGFAWSEIDPDWQEWDARRFRWALDNPIAQAGFKSDFEALEWCDTCILALPCGRSAHLELGWAVGAGKRTAILLDDKNEPELMYRMVDKLALTVAELVMWLERVKVGLA